MLPLPCSYGPAITSEEKAGERMAFKRLFYEVGRVQPLPVPLPLLLPLPSLSPAYVYPFWIAEAYVMQVSG